MIDNTEKYIERQTEKLERIPDAEVRSRVEKSLKTREEQLENAKINRMRWKHSWIISG